MAAPGYKYCAALPTPTPKKKHTSPKDCVPGPTFSAAASRYNPSPPRTQAAPAAAAKEEGKWSAPTHLVVVVALVHVPVVPTALQAPPNVPLASDMPAHTRAHLEVVVALVHVPVVAVLPLRVAAAHRAVGHGDGHTCPVGQRAHGVAQHHRGHERAGAVHLWVNRPGCGLAMACGLGCWSACSWRGAASRRKRRSRSRAPAGVDRAGWWVSCKGAA